MRRFRPAAPASPKAGKLRLVSGWQIGGEDGDADGGLVGGAVDAASGVVLGDGALDDAGTDPQPPGRHEAGQDEAADPAGEVDSGAGDDARGQGDLVAGGVQGDGEAGAVGVGAGGGRGGVGDGGAQGLVGDEQGVHLLLDAAGGAGPQDAAAADGGLQLEVGGLDLPALMVENGQVEGWEAGRVGQGGDVPAVAGEAAGAGGDGP